MLKITSSLLVLQHFSSIISTFSFCPWLMNEKGIGIFLLLLPTLFYHINYKFKNEVGTIWNFFVVVFMLIFKKLFDNFVRCIMLIT